MADKFIISTIFQIIDEATEPVKKIGRALGGLAEDMGRMSSKLMDSGKRMQDFGKNLSGIGQDLSMKLTAPIALIGGYAIKAAADMESLTAEFEVMLGSAEKAQELTGWIRDFAAATPFGIEDLSKSMKTMMAFNVTASDAKDAIKMLGDVAGSSPQKLESLTLAFAQVQAGGKLTGQDLLQMINAGFNPLQTIAAKSGKSMKVLRDEMSKGGISAEMVTQAFKDATSQGGLFFGNMEKQSKTFWGRFSTFMDALKTAAASLGQFLMDNFKLGDILRDATAWIESTVKTLQAWIKENPKLFKWIVILTGAIAVLGPVLMAVGTAITMIGMAVSGLSVLMNPITLVIMGIALAAFLLIKYWTPIKKFFVDLWNGIIRNIVAAVITLGILIIAPIALIVDLFKKYWKPVTVFFRNLWIGFIRISKEVGARLYNVFIQPFVDAWDRIKFIMSALFSGVKSALSPLFNFFVGLWIKIIDFCKIIGENLYNIFVQPFVKLAEGITVIFNKIKKALGFGFEDQNIKVKKTEETKIEKTEETKKEETQTKKTKNIFETISAGGGIGNQSVSTSELYENSPVAMANRKAMAESIKQTVAIENKSIIQIVLEAPDGFKAKAKNMKPGGNTDLQFELNYNTGILNPAFAG